MENSTAKLFFNIYLLTIVVLMILLIYRVISNGLHIQYLLEPNFYKVDFAILILLLVSMSSVPGLYIIGKEFKVEQKISNQN